MDGLTFPIHPETAASTPHMNPRQNNFAAPNTRKRHLARALVRHLWRGVFRRVSVS